MTCCIARPGVLCTDSRETGTIKREVPKHFRKHDYIVGCAGDCAALTAAEHLLKWPRVPTVANLTRLLHAHQDKDNCNFQEASLLVVTATKVLVCDGLYVFEAPCGGIGSGAPYALGYLRAAPDDLEGAVSAACYFDPYCAGPVRKVEL